ncbi:MAG: hypothetical protein U0527_06340 [Candidatus Eisenbacteria bacterium]
MIRMESALRLGAALGLVFVLSACGGGGSKDTAQQTPAAQSPAATPAQTTPPPDANPATPPNDTKTQTLPAAEKPKDEPKKEEPKHEEPKKEEPKEAFVVKVVNVPVGTALHVCLQNELSTEKETAGQPFDATIKGNVVVDGANVIPEGSTVKGQVTMAKRAPKVGGKAQMALEVKELITPDGKSYRLFAEPLTLEGESSTRSDVEKVVGGTVGGAIIGGILGGKSGALKGAAGGAAAGGVWAVVTRGNDIVLSPNQEMEFHLARAIGVTAKVPTNPLP